MDAGNIIMGILGVSVIFILCLVAFRKPTDEELLQRELDKMTDEERHQYWLDELEKIKAQERVRWVEYDKPSENFVCTEIMGLRYRSAEAKLAAKLLVPGDILHLRMEPKNKYDKFAVKILTEDDVFIGYVQRELSEFVARNFDCMLECRVSSIPDEAQEIAWGIKQSLNAVMYFTEDIEIPGK